MSRGGRLRLSGGRLGGRKISIPPAVRPTGARLREALMDLWSDRLAGARFLDLFTGSGAVGLEASGRGAAATVLVEGSSRVERVLRRTLAELRPGGVELVAGRLPRALAAWPLSAAAPFDLIFADPPYRFDAWLELLERCGPLLDAGGELAIEHDARVELPERAGRLELDRRRRYGDSALSFYRLAAGDSV